MTEIAAATPPELWKYLPFTVPIYPDPMGPDVGGVNGKNQIGGVARGAQTWTAVAYWVRDGQRITSDPVSVSKEVVR